MIHALVDTLNFATESGPGFYFFIAGGGEGSLLLPHQPGRDDFMASPQQEGEQKALVWAFGEKPLLFREGTCTAVDWGRGVWFYGPEQLGAGPLLLCAAQPLPCSTGTVASFTGGC